MGEHGSIADVATESQLHGASQMYDPGGAPKARAWIKSADWLSTDFPMSLAH